MSDRDADNLGDSPTERELAASGDPYGVEIGNAPRPPADAASTAGSDATNVIGAGTNSMLNPGDQTRDQGTFETGVGGYGAGYGGGLPSSGAGASNEYGIQGASEAGDGGAGSYGTASGGSASVYGTSARGDLGQTGTTGGTTGTTGDYGTKGGTTGVGSDFGTNAAGSAVPDVDSNGAPLGGGDLAGPSGDV